MSNETRQSRMSTFGSIWANLEISDLERLYFFQFGETLNIFSYRADTSIPVTIVLIGAGGQKLVAYLRNAPKHIGNEQISRSRLSKEFLFELQKLKSCSD